MKVSVIEDIVATFRSVGSITFCPNVTNVLHETINSRDETLVTIPRLENILERRNCILEEIFDDFRLMVDGVGVITKVFLVLKSQT